LNYNNEDFTKGLALAGKLNIDQTLSDLSDAINALKQLPEVSGKVGSIGFCLGGLISYRLACRGKVDAAVSYYAAVSIK